MRVLQVGKFYHPYKGGIETVLRNLCEGLRSRGHTVTCVVANTAPRTVRECIGGVNVVRAASAGMLRSVSVSPAFLSAFRRLARGADVVHVHQQNPLADLALLLTPPRAPVVVSCHSAIVRQRIGRNLWRPVLRRVWSRAARVVMASPALAALVDEHRAAGVVPAVVPYGIDLTAISANGRPAPHGPPHLLAVGRLVSYKGFDHLIAALPRIPEARLTIVGTGPLRDELIAQARQIGVADRLTLTGDVDDASLADLYRSCAVFVLPSVTPAEAFGVVQLEAMAHARPVVCTDLPTGVPWVNRHGETGLVVPPGSSSALADALRTLLGDPDLRARMGAAGRRRVETEFTVERMVERYEGVYSGA
ncbi:glycosyltransferase [Candidatus Binatia bacterium]|nr:glycosyltransferase [Candidatus Binatia bacterium]